MGRSTGSQRAALCRERGGGEGDFVLVTSAWAEQEGEEWGGRVCSQMGEQDSHQDAPRQGRLLERASRKNDLSLLQSL